MKGGMRLFFFNDYLPALKNALQKFVDESKTIDEINKSCDLGIEYEKIDKLFDKKSASVADSHTFAYFNINRNWERISFNKWKKEE